MASNEQNEPADVRPGRPFGDRRALVTGGTRGIGLATALALGRRGARVMLHYGQRDRHARQAVAAFESEGLPPPPLVKADLVDIEAASTIRQHVDAAFGELDFLVANAATGFFRPLMEATVEEWERTLNVTTRSLLLLAQELTPLMKRVGSAIVAVSSAGARIVLPHYGAIGVAKAALEAMCRFLAFELGPRGIRVNAVSTWGVDTLALRVHPLCQELLDYAREHSPLGRGTTPDDVAAAICGLLLPEAAWINGQTIFVDGGVVVSPIRDPQRGA